MLEQIHSPADIKSLDRTQIAALAAEMRHVIIQTVARNAGHLAPNLGVVELTLALHRVFDSPRDKIIWDVGHQSYPHKLVTGRFERFDTLRSFGGIRGYPARDESEHDPFGTCHGSTSISAALGFVVARDLAKQDHHVIAVIGDGALTGGMAFEGHEMPDAQLRGGTVIEHKDRDGQPQPKEELDDLFPATRHHDFKQRNGQNDDTG